MKTANPATTVLCWPGRLLSEGDLRRHWTNQGELVLSARTIVTPLAWDWLRSRKIHVRRDDAAKPETNPAKGIWGYAEESPSPLVAAAVRALDQEGRKVASLGRLREALPAWIRQLCEAAVRDNPSGVLVFSLEPGLMTCLANKIAGVRAASVRHANEVAALQKALGPNFYAISMPGQTYHELRQLLRQVTSASPACPANLTGVLQELDHAHR